MCKIDKEKLLKEIEEIKFYSTTVYHEVKDLIKNFPEEPEQPIDFDALYQEFCDLDNVIHSTVSFRDFLKSKNLTAPKPFEIPVKRYWTLKKEFYDFAINMFQPISLMQTTDKEPKHKQYYDMHTDIDYSKIPKGSIVELKNSLRRLVIVFNGVLGDKICGAQNDHYTINNYEVRVVELAKE